MVLSALVKWPSSPADFAQFVLLITLQIIAQS